MFNHFANNRGPVFNIDGVGSSGVSGGFGASGQMEALHGKAMQAQAQNYEEGMAKMLANQKLQMNGDAALKALKPVQIG